MAKSEEKSHKKSEVDKKEKKVRKEKKEKKDKKEKKEKLPKEETEISEPSVVEPSNEIPENPNSLDKFPLSASTIQNLTKTGITSLFPIQVAAFTPVYDGYDVIGRARTGTGKTLGFALPIIERLLKIKSSDSKNPKVLALCPTRELAKQVANEFSRVNPALRVLPVYGGVSYEEQERAFRAGLDVIVGTPGRLMDHMERQRLVFTNLEFLVLDEADQMLDIGFADAMESIIREAKKQLKEKICQILLFSATWPQWIDEIVAKYLRKDKMKKIDLVSNEKIKTNERITHKAIECSYHQRKGTLGDILRAYSGDVKVSGCRTIVFADTKNEANELALGSDSLQGIECQVLHGDIAQKQREITLQGFRDGKFGVLIATDVAARGLDIPNVDLVIQLNPPKDVDTFVHRSGRTGRAGKTGTNIVFYKPFEEWTVKNVQKKTGIVFEFIGAPQVNEILEASMKRIASSITGVDSKTMDLLLPVVRNMLEKEEELIHEGDTILSHEKLLVKCLYLLAGNNLPKPRSLISCNEGYIALMFKFGTSIRNNGLVRKMLKDLYPDMFADAFKNIRLLADSTGAVVDVPVEKLDYVLENTKNLNNGTIVEVVKSLPQMMPREQGSNEYSGHSQGNRWGNNRNSSYGNGSYGNNRFSQGYNKSNSFKKPGQSSSGFRKRQ